MSRELFEWFVPLRLDILNGRQIRVPYSAVWTPSFYFLDHRERLHYSIPGYLPPDDFRLIMRLELAAIYIPRGKYQEAIAIINDSLEKFPAIHGHPV